MFSTSGQIKNKPLHTFVTDMSSAPCYWVLACESASPQHHFHRTFAYRRTQPSFLLTPRQTQRPHGPMTDQQACPNRAASMCRGGLCTRTCNSIHSRPASAVRGRWQCAGDELTCWPLAQTSIFRHVLLRQYC